MNSLISNEKPAIYVTGFGPFGSHSENASQKVVESIATLAPDIEEDIGVQLHTEIFDVCYDSVLKIVPLKWKALKPKLVIHIGVSELATDVKLEKQAFNCNYVTLDIRHCNPASQSCIIGCPLSLQTDLDLEKAIGEVDTQTSSGINYSVSYDPGRYLCGFIYYLSLAMGKDRSLFIHVPKLDVVCGDGKTAASRLANSVVILIKCLYKQVQGKEKVDGDSSNIDIVMDKLKQQTRA